MAAFEFDGFERKCEKCQATLIPKEIEWLELNAYTGRYTKKEGECPKEESQGWFPFGKDCAKKLLKEQERNGKITSKFWESK